jgi:hypothetical protein
VRSPDGSACLPTLRGRRAGWHTSDTLSPRRPQARAPRERRLYRNVEDLTPIPPIPPSRLSRSRPDTSDGSSAFAPTRPCSSETVNSSSSGPWATSGSSATAIAPATRCRCRRRASSLGEHPVVVADDVDAPLALVVRAVRIPLADHVQVCLEDDRGRTLAAGRGRHPHDEVAGAVDGRCEAPLRRPGEDVVAHLGFLLRRAGMRVSPKKCRQTRRGSSSSRSAPLLIGRSYELLVAEAARMQHAGPDPCCTCNMQDLTPVAHRQRSLIPRARRVYRASASSGAAAARRS